jgi:hypothetical protein
LPCSSLITTGAEFTDCYGWTPAREAGIADHIWDLAELLT